MNKALILLILSLVFLTPTYGCDNNYYSTKKIAIKLAITEEISTKMPIIEGQSVNFEALETVQYGDLNLKKGDQVTGKIECIIKSGMNGFPAELILDNFEIPNVSKTQLISTYRKHGQNRCVWVYPLKWILTPFPPTGSITNIIKGGHAKIKPTDVITLYYYPEWN